MIGSQTIDMQLRLATVVVPVAVYFLILGLLNSRRIPQMLTSRQDFLLLAGAMSPVALLPAMDLIGAYWTMMAGLAVLALVGVAFFAAPGRSNWVIYNLPASQAMHVLQQALDSLGLASQACEGGLSLPACNATIQVRPFGLLRNVTVRLQGGDAALASRLADRLGQSLSTIPAEAHPMSVGLMLVATAMMVAPIASFVHQAPQIVRILTDLLH